MAPTGRSDGRRWGLPVAAYAEIPMAAVKPLSVLVDAALTSRPPNRSSTRIRIVTLARGTSLLALRPQPGRDVTNHSPRTDGRVTGHPRRRAIRGRLGRAETSSPLL